MKQGNSSSTLVDSGRVLKKRKISEAGMVLLQTEVCLVVLGTHKLQNSTLDPTQTIRVHGEDSDVSSPVKNTEEVCVTPCS